MNFDAFSRLLNSRPILIRHVEKLNTTFRINTFNSQKKNYFSERAAPKFIGALFGRAV